MKKEESTAKGSTAKGSTALPSSVRRPRAQADGNAILCRATSSLPACVFKWPSPGFELCVQSAWVDRTRSDPVWMVQFSYRHEGQNIYLDVAVTDRMQGMPDYGTSCRFVSVMPLRNAATQEPYIVICLRLLVEVWDAYCGTYNADQSGQWVVDKIWAPHEVKGKGRGGTTGKGKGQKAYQ